MKPKLNKKQKEFLKEIEKNRHLYDPDVYKRVVDYNLKKLRSLTKPEQSRFEEYKEKKFKRFKVDLDK